MVLQPKGFQVNEEGDLYDIPLDTAVVKLRLSTLSFRLQPRQAYTVFYEADADTVPYWFNIWNGITGSKTESGINLRIELPHVVYLYQKLKLAEPDITIRSVRYRPPTTRSSSSSPTGARAWAGCRASSPAPRR